MTPPKTPRKIEFIYRSKTTHSHLAANERWCDGLENGFSLRDRLVTLTIQGYAVEIQIGQLRAGGIAVNGSDGAILDAVDWYLSKCERAGEWDVRLPDGTLLPIA